MRRKGDDWVCSNCGHDLEIDRNLAMETALSLLSDAGPCSARDMSFAQTAVYIRTLELRWMQDQRRIRELEQQVKLLAGQPPERRAQWRDALLSGEQARGRPGQTFPN